MTELQLPHFTGWMIPDDALTVIAGLVAERRPRLIVEAGSGRSTIVLADALRSLGGGKLISLEHLEEFCESTRALLLTNGLGAFAEVRHAPLEEHGETEPLTPSWYARLAWGDLEAIDLLLVDGPPGHSGPLARDPAVPLLRDRLTPGALVILDDTHRPAEQEILRHWKLSAETSIPRAKGRLTYGDLS
jgi:predicted O-methyltransferase YrrM